MSSQSKFTPLDPSWSLEQVMARVTSILAGEAPGLQISTTGTDGKKIINIGAKALRESARASLNYLNSQNGQIWSLLLPLSHIAGVNVCTRAHELGTMPIDLRNEKDTYPDADFTAIVPTQLFRALHGDAKLLSHLQGAQAVLVGGAPLTSELRKSAQQSNINVIETYGSTETCGGCVYDGKALEGVSVRISDTGYIEVAGKTLAEVSLNDGWITMPDLGSLENGLLKVHGRSDDVIITGGENISMSAINEFISVKFPSLDFAPFSIQDPEWGSALYIAMVANVSISLQEVKRALFENFGVSGKPKGIIFVDKIPMIGIGKIDRVALTNFVLTKRRSVE